MKQVFQCILIPVHIFIDLPMQVLHKVSFTLKCQWTIALHSNRSRRNTGKSLHWKAVIRTTLFSWSYF